MDTRSLSHTRWKCQYHIVFIPKYRQKRLYGQLRMDVREIIRKLCEYKKVEIVNGAVCSNHVHLNVIIPPKISIAEFMGYLKGKSALKIFDAHPELRERNNRHFWATGYYVDTLGKDEDVIIEYIRNQYKEDKEAEI